MTAVDISGKDSLVSYIQESDKLLIVDFWAEWCGPCRMLGPVLHELGDKYSEKVQVLKVDVDDDANEEIATEYSVRSIPQVTFFKGGEQVDQFVGALPPDQVEAYILKHID